MKKLSSIIMLSLMFWTGSFAQKLSFKITEVEDTTVHLVKYVGSKLFYADTAKIVNGKVSFDGSKQKPGVLAVLFPGQKYFEFVYNNENVSLETKYPDFVSNMKVKKSKENKLFVEYMDFMRKSRETSSKYREKIATLEEEDEGGKVEEYKDKLKKQGDEVLAYQEKLVEENPNTLMAKIVEMSKEMQIPDAPVDEEGNVIDDHFAYHYYRNHYFDNIDLQDERLVNTPVFQNKLEYFYSAQMLSQHPDTIIKYIDPVLKQLKVGSEMYRFVVTNVTSNIEQSKIMGMDKVFNFLIRNYFCPTNDEGKYKAFWMDEERMSELCEDAEIRKELVLGKIPPNIILPDSTENKFYNLHELEADYTILYFWDPNCGHCKKITPKLEELYSKKLKDRNVEVFSVGKATHEDFKDWKKFIKSKNLSFINVGVTPKLYQQAKENPHSIIPSKTSLESINYQKTYDIYATPTVYILNKDKEIIAKKLSMAQIESMLDRLQGFEDSERILESDKEDQDVELHDDELKAE